MIKNLELGDTNQFNVIRKLNLFWLICDNPI